MLAVAFIRLMQQARLDRAAGLQRREQSFRRFIKEAVEASPFHAERCRRAGVRYGELGTPEELCRLPLMERADLCEQLEQVAATTVPVAKRRELRTSGSCGMPLKIWVGHHDRTMRQALQLRARWAAGRRPLWREAVIGTHGGDAGAHRSIRRGRSLYLSALEEPEQIARALRAFGPDYLVALPSALIDLGESPGIHPKLITTGAEVLDPGVREVIERRFGAPVRDIYGTIETGLLAFQCRTGEGYHLNEDEVYFEMLPADDRLDGMYELVVTPLFARATPLVRYRSGDLVRPLPGRCSCGMWMARIASIEGRRDDWCVRPDGRRVAPAAIRAIFRRDEPFMQYHVTQAPDGAVRLQLAGTPASEQHVRTLADALSNLVGRPVNLEVLASLPRDASGKRRAIRRLQGKLAA